MQHPRDKKPQAAAVDAGGARPVAVGVGPAGALLFAVCVVALAFEVALTRICSAVLQYHVSFAVVSLAVLGVGIGGFLAYAATRRADRRVDLVLRWSLVLVSPGILLALVILLRLPFAAHWSFLLFLVLPPFVAVGAFQSLLLRAFASRASALYAADLLGGAVGAAVARAGIDALGGPVNLALFLALLVAALAAWWGRRVGGARRFAGAAGLCIAFAFVAVLAQGVRRFLDVNYALAPQKLVAQMMQRTPGAVPRLVPELQRWDATSRVDVLELRALGQVQRLVFIDGETPTAMLAPESPAPGAAGLNVSETLPALPHRLLRPRRVLAIGAGGGFDVVVARRLGASDIDAVELNAGVLDVVDAAREFTGDVYGQPGVRVHHAEGRQFVEAAAPATYDLVTLVLAQSLAGNLQEYALSENYLYTREAFAAYLRVLRPDGALALLVNDERLLRRLYATAWDALAARGQEPAQCLVALTSSHESPYDRLLLVSTRPLPLAVRTALGAELATRDYAVLHVPPGTPGPHAVQLPRVAASPAPPATDDRPFVFHLQGRLPPALGLLLGTAAALLVVAWAALAWDSRRSAAGAPAVYFVLLGLGFMMVEVMVLQKSLLVIGTPTLNLAVVLCTFLVAAGAGSALSVRCGTPRALRGLLLLLVPCLFVLVWGLDRLHAQAAAWPAVARCLGVAGVVAPCAFLMGMPFPVAVRLLAPALRAFIPWFWGLNGVASILGSALVVTSVLQLGFRVATLLPVAAYLLAALVTTRFASAPAGGSN